MKKSNKGIIRTAIIIVSLAVVLVYLYARAGQINSMNAQTAKVRAENLSVPREKVGPGNMEKLFPEKAGIALFVENLYDAARMSGMKKHDVSTVKMADAGARRTVKKSTTDESGKVLKTYALKISLEGNYRDTVEYIREVQNIGRFKRITALGMKPVDRLLKTDMTIEIYSVGGQDVAQ
jgi:Tfp pilus assembly protein PilO